MDAISNGETYLYTNNSLLGTGGKFRSVLPVVCIPRGDLCIDGFSQRISRTFEKRGVRRVVCYGIKQRSNYGL
jgi:hypothetical protein